MGSEIARDVVAVPEIVLRGASRIVSAARGLRDRLLSWKGGRTLVGWSLGLLILLQVALVAYVARRHVPWFSFEESNTLRIASLPGAELSEAIAQDQNFPPYYAVLHALGSVFGFDGRPAIALNFATWLATLAVFLLVAREVLGNRAWALFATLLFAATASIAQYAWFVRMYAQTNLAVVVLLLGLARYARRGGPSNLGVAGLGAIGVCFLHPTGILAAGLFLLAGLPVARRARERVLVAAFAGSAFAVALVQALAKAEFHRTYLATGIEYTRQIRTPVHAFVGYLLGRTDGPYAWVYFVAAAVLVALFFARVRVLERIHFPLAVFVGALVALHFVLSSYSDAHHYYFLVAPLVLAMALGARAATDDGRRRRLVLVALPLVFLWGGLSFCRSSVRCDRAHESLVRAIRQLPPGAVVSDFILHNVVQYALPRSSRRTFILREGDLLETTDLSLKGTIIAQVRMGGLPGTGIASAAYRSRLAKALADRSHLLRQEVREIAEQTGSVGFVLPLNRTLVFPEELDLFHDLPFRGTFGKSVYWFARTPPGEEATLRVSDGPPEG